jgi:hypothetical protein
VGEQQCPFFDNCTFDYEVINGCINAFDEAPNKSNELNVAKSPM